MNENDIVKLETGIKPFTVLFTLFGVFGTGITIYVFLSKVNLQVGLLVIASFFIVFLIILWTITFLRLKEALEKYNDIMPKYKHLLGNKNRLQAMIKEKNAFLDAEIEKNRVIKARVDLLFMIIEQQEHAQKETIKLALDIKDVSGFE